MTKNLKQQAIEAAQNLQGNGYELAKVLAKARAELTAEDFAEVTRAAGMSAANANRYANVGGDEGIAWAVHHNMMKAPIGVLVYMTGIPAGTMKQAAKDGLLSGLRQKDAAALRRSLLGKVVQRGGRKPRMVIDDWPVEWRSVADRLVNLNLAASALRGQLGATVSTMKAAGTTDKKARASLLKAIKANLPNMAVNGTGESRSMIGDTLLVRMEPTDPEGSAIVVEVRL